MLWLFTQLILYTTEVDTGPILWVLCYFLKIFWVLERYWRWYEVMELLETKIGQEICFFLKSSQMVETNSKNHWKNTTLEHDFPFGMVTKISGAFAVCFLGRVLPVGERDFLSKQAYNPEKNNQLQNSVSHRIHGTGIFTYMNGWFLCPTPPKTWGVEHEFSAKSATHH